MIYLYIALFIYRWLFSLDSLHYIVVLLSLTSFVWLPDYLVDRFEHKSHFASGACGSFKRIFLSQTFSSIPRDLMFFRKHVVSDFWADAKITTDLKPAVFLGLVQLIA